MRESDYKQLEESLFDEWSLALAAFAASPNNTSVYVVAAQIHYEYAGPLLSLNTESGFEAILARYPDHTRGELSRFGDARWNPAEFLYFNIAPSSASTERFSERYEKQVEKSSDTNAASHALRLTNALVGVVKKLTTSFKALDRTPNFVSYVWSIDSLESERIELARQTIPKGLFDRLFPEVRATKNFMAKLARLTKTEQASFWAAAVRDLVLKIESTTTKTMRGLDITAYEAIDALVAVGPAAIAELVGIAEEHALAEEWNKRGSAEWNRRGAQTRRGDLASSALLALEDFNDAPDEIVRRLQLLLKKLHERDRVRALAGVNGQLTARALHALRQAEYPPAEFSDKTNHLLNAGDFGVR